MHGEEGTTQERTTQPTDVSLSLLAQQESGMLDLACLVVFAMSHRPFCLSLPPTAHLRSSGNEASRYDCRSSRSWMLGYACNNRG